MRPTSVLLLGSLLLLAQPPARAEAPETLRLSADNLGNAFETLSTEAKKTQEDINRRRRSAASRRRAALAERNALPEVCASLPVVYIRNGDIYKNDEQIGARANSYKANCDGFVAWVDSYGDLYLDRKELASRTSGFDLSWYGDTVVWKDSHGELYKHSAGATKRHDRVSSYTFLRYTGDVIWRDTWGDLHRNEEKLGRDSGHKIAQRTGDVAWKDSYGSLYKNRDLLGRCSDFRIADRTGDVAWTDGYGTLYKGDKAVARYPSSWELREDGVLIWRDSSGHYHHA
ncbi:MAG: hypothetical protein HY748_00150 [Elusimicrobia bacterium]|nr:hypothetical protein [Elusimicrobiota bacterium]